jgi:hypothetical protein
MADNDVFGDNPEVTRQALQKQCIAGIYFRSIQSFRDILEQFSSISNFFVVAVSFIAIFVNFCLLP